MSLIITGNPGVGKHTIANEILKTKNFQLLDINKIAIETNHVENDDIGNMKYEKFQIIDVQNFSQRATGLYPILSETPMELNIQTTRTNHDWITSWKIHYCADFTDLGHEFKCIPLFNSLTSSVSIAMDDIVTNQWTILRVLN